MAEVAGIVTPNTAGQISQEFQGGSFVTEESTVALLFGLVASAQIKLRRIDGYRYLSGIPGSGKLAA